MLQSLTDIVQHDQKLWCKTKETCSQWTFYWDIVRYVNIFSFWYKGAWTCCRLSQWWLFLTCLARTMATTKTHSEENGTGANFTSITEWWSLQCLCCNIISYIQNNTAVISSTLVQSCFSRLASYSVTSAAVGQFVFVSAVRCEEKRLCFLFRNSLMKPEGGFCFPQRTRNTQICCFLPCGASSLILHVELTESRWENNLCHLRVTWRLNTCSVSHSSPLQNKSCSGWLTVKNQSSSSPVRNVKYWIINNKSATVGNVADQFQLYERT